MAKKMENPHLTQYKVLEFQTDSVGISLSSACCCRDEKISILPEKPECRAGLYFSVMVTEQNVFRMKEFYELTDIFCSVSSDLFAGKTARHAAVGSVPERSGKLRRFYTSPCALYKAVGRIRL